MSVLSEALISLCGSGMGLCSAYHKELTDLKKEPHPAQTALSGPLLVLMRTAAFGIISSQTEAQCVYGSSLLPEKQTVCFFSTASLTQKTILICERLKSIACFFFHQ